MPHNNFFATFAAQLVYGSALVSFSTMYTTIR